MSILLEMARKQNERAAAQKCEMQEQPNGRAVPWSQVIQHVFGATVDEPDAVGSPPDSWAAYFKHQETVNS